MTISILPAILSISISLLAIGHILGNMDKFYLKTNTILFSLIYLILGLAFPLFFNISLELRDPVLRLHLWILMILSRIIAFGLIFILFSSVLSVKKIELIYILAVFFFFGLIVAFSYSHISIAPSINSFSEFEVFLLPIAIIAYDGLIIIFIFLKSRKLILKSPKSTFEKIFLFYYILLICYSSLFLLYLITNEVLLGNISLFLNLFSLLALLYLIVKEPYKFISYANKIYDFIIFQKSGVLLYSYNFDTNEETEDIYLKGSILIGINHIISNIIDKQRQLDLIQVRDRDIVFEFDKNYGYALLLITNKKNTIIEKSMKNFVKHFNETNKEILIKIANLSQLIDISEFSNIKDLLNKNFKPFLADN